MNDLMTKAIELMAAGMGFVFSFLIVLVFATLFMSRIVVRFAPAEPATPARAPRSKPSRPAAVDPDTAEAIRQAVAKFRARHDK